MTTVTKVAAIQEYLNNSCLKKLEYFLGKYYRCIFNITALNNLDGEIYYKYFLGNIARFSEWVILANIISVMIASGATCWLSPHTNVSNFYPSLVHYCAVYCSWDCGRLLPYSALRCQSRKSHVNHPKSNQKDSVLTYLVSYSWEIRSSLKYKL